MSQRNVVLLLPGQGAQRVGMGFGLYGTDPVFTASMDGLLDASLRRVWLSGGCSLDDGVVAQPLLFAFGCSLGRALLSWGVRPSVLLGHSVGELACAALAGVWPACSIRRLIAERTAVLGGAPDGGMLAIGAGVDEVRRLLPVGVAVAAVNSPRQVVVSERRPIWSPCRVGVGRWVSRRGPCRPGNRFIIRSLVRSLPISQSGWVGFRRGRR